LGIHCIVSVFNERGRGGQCCIWICFEDLFIHLSADCFKEALEISVTIGFGFVDTNRWEVREHVF
jgi:hypothetical protein